RALADAAVCDHRLIAVDSLRRIEPFQLVEALEGAVLVAVLAPRDALGARNVAAALARLGQSGRREDFAGEFLRAPDVDERRRLAAHGLLDLGKERAQRDVGRADRVLHGRERRLVGAQVARLSEPFLAPAVHDAHVVVAVYLELPERPRGE